MSGKPLCQFLARQPVVLKAAIRVTSTTSAATAGGGGWRVAVYKPLSASPALSQSFIFWVCSLHLSSAIRLEAIALRLVATALRLEAIALTSRLEFELILGGTII